MGSFVEKPDEVGNPKSKGKTGLVGFFVDVALFLFLGGAAFQRVSSTLQFGTFDYIEISFALQNAVLILVILVRFDHKVLDKNLWHQIVALTAVFSGLVFVDIPPPADPMLLLISKGTVFAANLLGIVTLLNLGRSFAFLIALREVRTTGAYSIVRHPMYGTDILLRVGYIMGNADIKNLILFFLSTSCYIYRAILEERFLAETAEYREFMKRVKYRFIPYVF